mmetsp:Transcript_20591/g.50513  ORF Transcript_20591/g.50513 Transcript_20591/m.50513 type:complete len:111 (-) Transcript_20591:129-461(-)
MSRSAKTILHHLRPGGLVILASKPGQGLELMKRKLLQWCDIRPSSTQAVSLRSVSESASGASPEGKSSGLEHGSVSQWRGDMISRHEITVMRRTRSNYTQHPEGKTKEDK